MREGRCISLIECLKVGSEVKTEIDSISGHVLPKIDYMFRKKVGSNEAIAKVFENLNTMLRDTARPNNQS